MLDDDFCIPNPFDPSRSGLPLPPPPVWSTTSIQIWEDMAGILINRTDRVDRLFQIQVVGWKDGIVRAVRDFLLPSGSTPLIEFLLSPVPGALCLLHRFSFLIKVEVHYPPSILWQRVRYSFVFVQPRHLVRSRPLPLTSVNRDLPTSFPRVIKLDGRCNDSDDGPPGEGLPQPS